MIVCKWTSMHGRKKTFSIHNMGRCDIIHWSFNHLFYFKKLLLNEFFFFCVHFANAIALLLRHLSCAGNYSFLQCFKFSKSICKYAMRNGIMTYSKAIRFHAKLSVSCHGFYLWNSSSFIISIYWRKKKASNILLQNEIYNVVGIKRNILSIYHSKLENSFFPFYLESHPSTDSSKMRFIGDHKIS